MCLERCASCAGCEAPAVVTADPRTQRAPSFLEIVSKLISHYFDEEQDGTISGAQDDFSAGSCEDWRVNFASVPPEVLHLALSKDEYENGRACGACVVLNSPEVGYADRLAVVVDVCNDCGAGEVEVSLLLLRLFLHVVVEQ